MFEKGQLVTETYSSQYRTSCIVVEEADLGDYTIDEIIEEAIEKEATYHDGEDVCLVVQLPGRPIELYTKRAFRMSFKDPRER